MLPFCCVFILTILSVCGNGIFAYAKSLKQYEVYAPDITKFQKSGNKIIIQAVKEWNDGIKLNGKVTNIKKISLKLSLDCKWSQSDPGAKNYRPLSYKEMRKHILEERKEFKKYGEYGGGSGVFITIKKGKVIRVNFSSP